MAFDSEERDRVTLNLPLRLAEKSGGRLTIAHVPRPLPVGLLVDSDGQENLREMLGRAADEVLQKFVASLPDTEVPITTRILTGDPVLELVREVLRNGHDLLMSSSRTKTGVPGQHLVSLNMRLLRKCPCPVWIQNPDGPKELKTVLAAVDPTYSEGFEEELNRSILELGQRLVELDEADFHVIYAWSAWGENRLRGRLPSDAFGAYVMVLKSRAAKAFSHLLKPYGSVIPPRHRHLIQGDPEEVVPDFARDRAVSLIVMGTVARTGVPGFLIGNTAEKILGRVRCSVLAVKPEGFVTPVELEGSERLGFIGHTPEACG